MITDTKIELQPKKLDIFKDLTQRVEYTESEIKQGQLFRDYLKSSGATTELFNFVDKALKNYIADSIKKDLEREREDEIKERDNYLHYV